jgi:hypothetical protein
VGPAIARALRRPTADITRTLRGCRGIIDLDLTEIDAGIVASILERRSIEARIVDSGEIPPLPKPVLLLDADPVPEGIEIQRVSGPGGPGHLPWGRLKIAAVGTVTFTPMPGRENLAQSLFSEGPPSGGIDDLVDSSFSLPVYMGRVGSFYTGRTRVPQEPKKKPRPETVHCLDLITTGPVPRYQVVASRFVYDYLGDRMKLCSRDNFRTLIEDIARYSPHTLLSGTTLSFIENPKSRHHRFASGEEFDAYVRWLTAWEHVFGGE